MYNTSFTIVFIIKCAAPSHLTQCTMAAAYNQKCTPTRATCGCCHEPSITIRNNGFPRRYTENGSCGLLTYSCFSAPSSSYPPPSFWLPLPFSFPLCLFPPESKFSIKTWMFSKGFDCNITYISTVYVVKNAFHFEPPQIKSSQNYLLFSVIKNVGL